MFIHLIGQIFWIHFSHNCKTLWIFEKTEDEQKRGRGLHQYYKQYSQLEI